MSSCHEKWQDFIPKAGIVAAKCALSSSIAVIVITYTQKIRDEYAIV
ncbi:hypothetical protein ACVBE9_07605 [Eionea flava]